jgi:predicted TPR repeat methyltransferase
MPRHRADLVSAADVLMYLGSLDAVFPLVLELLSPQGIFAFSVEDAGEAEGCVLKDSFRYAHSEVYVRTLLARHGLVPVEIAKTVIRMEAGKPVPGILFLSRKAA